jgi:hypothetical protein
MGALRPKENTFTFTLDVTWAYTDTRGAAPGREGVTMPGRPVALGAGVLGTSQGPAMTRPLAAPSVDAGSATGSSGRGTVRSPG